MEQWFARHTVCPVAGCDCQCALLDAGMLGRAGRLAEPGRE